MKPYATISIHRSSTSTQAQSSVCTPHVLVFCTTHHHTHVPGWPPVCRVTHQSHISDISQFRPYSAKVRYTTRTTRQLLYDIRQLLSSRIPSGRGISEPASPLWLLKCLVSFHGVPVFQVFFFSSEMGQRQAFIVSNLMISR